MQHRNPCHTNIYVLNGYKEITFALLSQKGLWDTYVQKAQSEFENLLLYVPLEEFRHHRLVLVLF